MFLGKTNTISTKYYLEQIERLREKIETADAVVLLI